MDFPELYAFYCPATGDYKRANGRVRTFSSKKMAEREKKYHTDSIIVKLTATWEDQKCRQCM